MIGELHIDTVFIFFIIIHGTRNILLLLQSKQTFFFIFCGILLIVTELRVTVTS